MITQRDRYTHRERLVKKKVRRKLVLKMTMACIATSLNCLDLCAIPNRCQCTLFIASRVFSYFLPWVFVNWSTKELMARLVFWELTIDIKSLIFNVFSSLYGIFSALLFEIPIFVNFWLKKLYFQVFMEILLKIRKKCFEGKNPLQ